MSLLQEEIQGTEAFGGILLDIEQRLRRLDVSDVLEEFQHDLERSHEENWTGRHNPVGVTWPPLAASTIARKGHDQPLVLTGDLKQSMVDIHSQHHVGEVFPLGLTYGTDLDYAVFHQDGTGRIPQREFAGLSPELCDDLVERIADAVVEKLKYTIRG